MYSDGTLFIDRATGYMKIYNQVSLGASDTVRRKDLYEQHAGDMGVKLKKYHRDNGVFKTKAFKKSLEERHQDMKYSRIGAHRQNGGNKNGSSLFNNNRVALILVMTG